MNSVLVLNGFQLILLGQFYCLTLLWCLSPQCLYHFFFVCLHWLSCLETGWIMVVILGFPVWFLTLMRSLCFYCCLRYSQSCLNNHWIPTCAYFRCPSGDHQDHNCSCTSWVYFLLQGCGENTHPWDSQDISVGEGSRERSGLWWADFGEGPRKRGFLPV